VDGQPWSLPGGVAAPAVVGGVVVGGVVVGGVVVGGVVVGGVVVGGVVVGGVVVGGAVVGGCDVGEALVAVGDGSLPGFGACVGCWPVLSAPGWLPPPGELDFGDFWDGTGRMPDVGSMPIGVTCDPPRFPDGPWTATGEVAAGVGCAVGSVAGISAALPDGEEEWCSVFAASMAPPPNTANTATSTPAAGMNVAGPRAAACGSSGAGNPLRRNGPARSATAPQ